MLRESDHDDKRCLSAESANRGGTFALSGPARRLHMTGIPPPVAASAELLPGAGQRLVPPIHARDAAIPAEEEGAFLWVRV